jgi:hypothetical protein
MPSSHEFANRIVNNKRYRAKSVGNKDREKEKPRDQIFSFTTSDPPLLTDHTDRSDTSKPPSTRSAGASPANVTTPLPLFSPTDNSSTTVTTSSAALASSLRPSASRPLAALSGSVSQSIPPVLALVGAASDALVPPAPRDSSVPTAPPTSATVLPSPVTNHNVQPIAALYPVTRPADDVNPPASHDPLALPCQSPNPPNSQGTSTDPITPTSIHVLTPTSSIAPQHSADEPDPDTIYDGTSTPVPRQRPESAASISTALVGAACLSRASSLSSSRPAPPSPAPSRRASQQVLQRNSSLRRSASTIAGATGGGSNLGRSASTRSAPHRRSSTFSMSSLVPPIDTAVCGLQVTTTLSPTVEMHNPGVEEARPLRPIIVRDFAYGPQDHWFSARPIELLPRSERESKRDSSASRSSQGLGGWCVHTFT